VIEAIDVSTIYEVPLRFAEQQLDDKVMSIMNLKTESADLNQLQNIVKKIKEPQSKIKIAICGKYTKLKDAYKSITEAFVHAAVVNNTRVILNWVDSEDVEMMDQRNIFPMSVGSLFPAVLEIAVLRES